MAKHSNGTNSRVERTATDAVRIAKVQKFAMERVHRADIQNAPYNPRQIDDHARRKLTENLKKKGLLQPLVWNRRTGNLVSGHQRLSIMDDLERDDNYAMDIAVVDMSPEDEREQNVFFNNPSAQGTWDIDQLADLIKDKEIPIDPHKAGFDDMDLQLLFDDTELAPMFSEESQPDEVKEDGNTIEEIQAMKEARREHKETDPNDIDTEFYAVVVFPDREAQARFMRALGVDKDERYVDGNRVQTVIDAGREKKQLPDGFIELSFVVGKDQARIIEGELRRVGSLLTGKNVRGRALEYIAVNSSQTPTENLTGEKVPSEKLRGDERKKLRVAHLKGQLKKSKPSNDDSES